MLVENSSLLEVRDTGGKVVLGAVMRDQKEVEGVCVGENGGEV